MKVGLIQSNSKESDVSYNREHHVHLVEKAAELGAEVIIFPELSIIGYSRQVAKDRAFDPDDPQFDVFQSISDTRGILIGVGVPVKQSSGCSISMMIFQPNIERTVYSKKYLHSSEQPFFVPGDGSNAFLQTENEKAAIAICYEISCLPHAENAAENHATLYIASVADDANGIAKAYKRLPEIAKQYSMTVVLSNCLGTLDGYEFAGSSAAWNSKGELVTQMDDHHEGILVFDTKTEHFQKSICE